MPSSKFVATVSSHRLKVGMKKASCSREVGLALQRGCGRVGHSGPAGCPPTWNCAGLQR